jgi:hypothetical protein
MSDEEAEARAAALLGELRAVAPPHRDDLAVTIALRARWQRQLRRALVSIGDATGGIAGGLGSLLRGRR